MRSRFKIRMDDFRLYTSQLKAMLIRNMTVKLRERWKFAWEIVLPLYSFAVLALMKAAIPNPHYPAIEESPYTGAIFDNYSMYVNYTVAVVPNTTEVQEFLEHARTIWDSFRNGSGNELDFVLFDSRDELHERYWYDPASISMAVIFDTIDPISDEGLEYEIRTNPSFTSTPTSGTLYADQSLCRHSTYALAKALEKSKILEDVDCPAYRYYASGFVTLQVLLDFTKISLSTGVDVNLAEIDLRLFPKKEYTASDWLLIFRLLLPAYLVMSLSQFITNFLMLVVKEKERRITETLKIAGLKNSVFWLSWFLVYVVFVIVIALAATSSTFYLGVFQHCSFSLIFVFIMLYGFSVIVFGFMLVPFLNHFRTAGVIGNFVLNTVSLLYLVRLVLKKIDVRFLWTLSLLSPAAFTLAMDKVLTMDVQGAELNWNNMWSDGGLSFGHSLIILIVDSVLYAALAWYFDLVIPDECGGTKRHPLFFLRPIYEICRRVLRSKNKKSNAYAVPADRPIDENIEPVPNSLKDKIGIEIIDLHKNYSSAFGKKKVSVLNGINLTIYEGQITAILGHNGAGKTTLFNILTGSTAPSSGTALIFGHDIRNPRKLNIVQKMFGVCPQHNILFENLCVKEHLMLYSAIRGIPTSKQNVEVDEALNDIGLLEQADFLAKHLSGGQKRKLTIACAIVGSPKILIMDEPTAGVDPYSRRAIWSALQKHKAGKVTLLTTHYMDEADLLADRKAVISKGNLRCVGTSLFLKNKFGIGYHLTFVLENNNLSREVYRAVRRHVPEVELARHNGKEMSLILPYHSVRKFAALFNEIESDINHGNNRFQISNYGISMTTLEEVFLYLEKSDELISQEGSIGNRILRHRIEGVESSSLRRRRISSSASNDQFSNDFHGTTAGVQLPAASDIGLRKFETNPNSCDIVYELLKIRFLIFIRTPWRAVLIVFLPILFFAIGIHFVYKENANVKAESLTLDNHTFENSTFLVWDASGRGFASYFDYATSTVESASKIDVGNLTNAFGIFKINDCCDRFNLTIMYNDTTVHSLPMMVNILDNALYKFFLRDSSENENRTIIVRTYPFMPKMRVGLFDFGLVTIAFGVGIQFIAISVILATDYIYDRELHAKNLLRVNGLSFWTYYGTFFVNLASIMLLIVVLHLITILLFDLAPFKQAASFGVLSFLFVLYSPCAILFATTISYLFRSAETNQSVLLNSTTLVGLMPFAIVLILELSQLQMIYMFVVHAIFSIFNSFYLPFAIMYFVGRIYLGCLSNEACSYVTLRDYFTPEILIIATSCCLQIPMLSLILQLVDYWKSGGNPQAIENHRVKTRTSVNNEFADDENDSEDVKYEKFRVSNSLASGTASDNYPLVIMKDVKKHYRCRSTPKISHSSSATTENQQSTSKLKLAIAGLTFAVDSGEIFGLLGHNGSGKTTSMKILTREELPDRGVIQLKGLNILEEDFKDIFEFLGYCPQDDVLWKNITVEEHLRLYATIRGISRDKLQEIVDVYLSGLRIKEHANKFSYQCSGGTKRKLSFAMAMIGNPSVVLMDEPSAGMDPKSKRFLWDIILCSFQDGKSAIITSQLMEEMDALCSRVGILVNGKLKCVGTTQHLKNLYGGGYRLEIKIATDDSFAEERENRAKRFVGDVFPASTLEETFCDHLVFSIPQSSVRSLGHCFTEIENAKEFLNIEEYSFSQTTLEQIFLKFAHAENKMF